MQNYIMNYQMIDEGSFTMEEGAIPWEVLSKYYQLATKAEKTKLMELVKEGNWTKFKEQIYKKVE